MTLTCEQMDERIVELLYGELHGDQRSIVEAHIAGCARCRAEVEGLRQTRALVRGVLDEDEAPPARVRASILAAAAAQVRAPTAAAAPARSPSRAAGGTAEKARGPSFWDWIRSRWTLPTLATVGAVAVFLLSSRIFMDPNRTLERGRAGIVPAETPAPATEPAPSVPQAEAPADNQPAASRPASPPLGGLHGLEEQTATGKASSRRHMAAKKPPSVAYEPEATAKGRAADRFAGEGFAGEKLAGKDNRFAAPPPPAPPPAASRGQAAGAGVPGAEPQDLRLRGSAGKKRKVAAGPRDEEASEGPQASGGAGFGTGASGVLARRPAGAAASAPPSSSSGYDADDDVDTARAPAEAAKAAPQKKESRRAAAPIEDGAMETGSAAEAKSDSKSDSKPAKRPSRNAPAAREEREMADDDEPPPRAPAPRPRAAAAPAAPAAPSFAPPPPPPSPAAPASVASAPARDKGGRGAETLVARADRLFAQHRWIEAAVAYRDLLRQDPRNSEAGRWRKQLAAAEAAQPAAAASQRR